MSWADNTDKFIKTFSYDTQGRLANADIPGVSRTDYGYDWVGNRTSPTAVYNDADQLTSYNGNSYAYNSYGDMTGGAGRTYSINTSTGRVSSVMLGTEGYEYTYDPYGNRIDATYDIDGGSADWTVNIYDITAGVPALLAEYHPWGSVDDCYYVREPNGELIMRVNGTDKKYYHFDELGSTLFLTDANGIQTDKYVYNAWGKVVSSSGSTVNPYRYIGQYGYYYDTETNLYLLGKRYYDADAGVFCQRDEYASDDGNDYNYADSDPMAYIDTDGNSAAKPKKPKPDAIEPPVDCIKNAINRFSNWEKMERVPKCNKLKGDKLKDCMLAAIQCLILQESTNNPRVVRKNGATGYMQIKAGIHCNDATEYLRKIGMIGPHEKVDLTDGCQNISYGVKYLNWCLAKGQKKTTTQCYTGFTTSRYNSCMDKKGYK